jgi:hypothetical protein
MNCGEIDLLEKSQLMNEASARAKNLFSFPEGQENNFTFAVCFGLNFFNLC